MNFRIKLTHVNFVEGFAEEEQGSAEGQLGGGVRAGLQALVSGCFSELEQLLQLQSPGPNAQNTQAQQTRADPQPAPAHLLSQAPRTRSDQRASPVKEAGDEARAAGDTHSRSGGARRRTEGEREARKGGVNGWRRGGTLGGRGAFK